MGAIADHLRRQLEQDIRTKGLLVWLDTANEYTPLVDQWIEQHKQGTFHYPIYAFRGSFLELMQKGREVLSRKDSPKCVIHMPCFNETDIKDTPVYEAYKAGQRWRKSLDTAIRETAQGRMTEDQSNHLLSLPNLDLAKAEEYFDIHSDVPKPIQTLLTKYGEDGFVIRFLTQPSDVLKELCLSFDKSYPMLMEYFHKLVGLDNQWEQDWNPHQKDEIPPPEDQADLLLSYLMCMEFVDDLQGVDPPSVRFKRLKDKSKEYHRKGDSLLQQIRDKLPERYMLWADQVESNLSDHETHQNPQNLGKVDTFRFEADSFVKEAIRLLSQSEWKQALSLAQIRLPNRHKESLANTFWLKQDRQRFWLWEWVEKAAELGTQVIKVNQGLNAFNGKAAIHSDYLDIYTKEWHKLDRLHREFSILSERHHATHSGAYFSDFVDIRKTLRDLYRDTIDIQAKQWNQFCETNGFLPSVELQQRHFFAHWVKPVLGKGKVAVFFVDALRYELAEELLSLVKEIGGTSQLNSIFAELPTITSVGMNVLAPVVMSNEIVPIIDAKGMFTGFQGGARQVRTPDDRAKAMQDVSGIETALESLDGILNKSDRSLRSSLDKELLLVTTQEIDEMGETGVMGYGLDTFSKSLGRIKGAIQKLKESGFVEFLITADHGFLIGDESLRDGIANQLPNVQRRHALTDMPRNSEQLVSVNFNQLDYRISGQTRAIIFARHTHLMTRSSNTSFYHGGNTLQERIIPVLKISSKNTVSDDRLKVKLKFEKGATVMGYHRLIVTATSMDLRLFSKNDCEVKMFADAGVEVKLGEVVNGTVAGELIKLPLDKSCEIFFALSGSGGKAQVGFESIQSTLTLQDAKCDIFFDINANVKKESVTLTTKKAKEESAISFHADIPSEFHAALVHLAKHKALSERFLVNTLGGEAIGSRKARRFATSISDWIKNQLLPFDVYIETTGEGKEYRVKGYATK